jgi:hypothetical protein
MSFIHAIVHTVGATKKDGRYLPLEVAYRDCFGTTEHYLINSPESYKQLVKNGGESDVYVTRNKGMSAHQVHKSLRRHFNELGKIYGKSQVVFGYKGYLLQPRFLLETGIPNIVKLDLFGVKPLAEYDSEYKLKGGRDVHCSYHPKNKGKCALRAIELMSEHVFGVHNARVVKKREEQKMSKTFVFLTSLIFSCWKKWIFFLKK